MAMVRWAALAVAALALIAVIIIYLARGEIARSLAQTWLRDHGMTASLQVDRLSLGGFSGRLTIGDPDAPDLIVDHVEIDYHLDGPWDGRALGVEARAVRLTRPRLRVGYDGRRWTIGSMQRALEDFLAHPPPPGARLPDIAVADGQAFIRSPWGQIAIAGSGAIKAGRLVGASGAIAPFTLAGPGGRIASTGGPMIVRATAETLTGDATLNLSTAQSRNLTLADAQLSLQAQAPYPRSGIPDAGGPIRIAATLVAGRVAAGTRVADHVQAHLNFDGRLSLAPARQVVSGMLQADIQAATLSAPMAASGPFSGAVLMRDLSAVHEAKALSVAAAVSGQVKGRGLRLGEISISQFTSAYAGRLAGHRLSIAGNLHADGAVSPSARRMFDQAPPGVGRAVGQALAGFRIDAPAIQAELANGGLILRLAKPVSLAARTGAQVVIASRGADPILSTQGGEHGAANLVAQGGGLPFIALDVPSWAAQGPVLTAELSARSVFDAGPVRQGRIEAKGRLSLSPAAVRLDLAGCAPFSAERIEAGQNPVSALTGRLCGDGAPLLATSGSAWRVGARGEHLGAAVAGFSVDDLGAVFSVAGNAAGLRTGAVRLDHAIITDKNAAPVVHPLAIQGRAETANGHLWRAELTFATAKGHRLGGLAAHHDLLTGEGGGDVDATRLVFTANGLQPGEISPLAAFARNAEGQAGLTAWATWKDGAFASGAAATAHGLAFRSPLGGVAGLSADIRATGLNPLALAPSRVTIAHVDGLLSIDDIDATFQASPSVFKLDHAVAKVAKGEISVEPLEAALSKDATVKGVFDLKRIDLGDLLASSSLAESVKMQALINGRLPFEFDNKGFRLVEGRAAAVGPGRLAISRTALTGLSTGPAGGAPVNIVQDLAYQAMENLAFDSLDATLASTANGRLGMLFHIVGRNDPAIKRETYISVRSLLDGSAFRTPLTLPPNTPIDLTLDTSLNFSEVLHSIGDILAGDPTANAASSAFTRGSGAPALTPPQAKKVQP